MFQGQVTLFILEIKDYKLNDFSLRSKSIEELCRNTEYNNPELHVDRYNNSLGKSALLFYI